MKTLVKVALGAVAFFGISELFCVDSVAIMWRQLMMRYEGPESELGTEAV